MEKFNKKLKGSNPLLMSRRLAFERVRTFWAKKKGVWCAIDFEGWEMEHTMITEFGWSIIRWENGEEVADHGHLQIKEALGYRNGKYVADKRMVRQFVLLCFLGFNLTIRITTLVKARLSPRKSSPSTLRR